MRSAGQPFRDSLVALEFELRRNRLGVLAMGLAGLAVATLVWLLVAQINLYAISRSARIEREEVQPVVAESAGRLTFSKVELGRQVSAGELIAELDHEVETRQLVEAERRLAALRSKLTAVRTEVDSERVLLDRETRAAEGAAEAARARLNQAKSAEGLADADLARINRMGKFATEADRVRYRATAEQQQAMRAAAEADVRRTGDEVVVRQTTVRVRIDRIKQSLVELEGAQNTAAAAVEVALRRVELRRIYASRSGKIVGIAGHQVGSAVREGERIATILTDGTLRVVANYTPQEAVGRVHEGQHGTMRVTGFPWAQFGVLGGRVTRVAAEPSNDFIRVELSLDETQTSRIPLQHGLDGTVEIVVDRMTPLSLFSVMLGDLVRPSGKAVQ